MSAHIFPYLGWLKQQLMRSFRHPAAHWALIVLMGIIGAWLAVMLYGGSQARIRLATLHGEFQPAWSGQTRVLMPPFGAISAHTHAGPLRLVVRIDELHVEPLIDWVKNKPTHAETHRYLRETLVRFLGKLVLQTVGMALLGACLLSLLLGARGRKLLIGTAAGVLAIALPITVAAATFHLSAFSNPVYQGELAHAPGLLQAVQQGWKNYATLEERVPVIVDRMVHFYRQLDAVSVTPLSREGDLRRVLHISDLHNNPLGMRFALDLAREYQVDLVLVTGDITDMGHPLEAELLTRWKTFTVPVVVISGNHDSRAIMDRLAQIPGVTVLDGGRTATVAGLTIMGFGDPAANRAAMGSVDPTPEELQILRERVTTRLALGPVPDILMVHNNRVAEELLGRAPVILTGHSHTAKLDQDALNVVVNPGTTGASGVRYFTTAHQVPYGAAVLHFSRQATPRLKLIDSIQLLEPEGNFVIRRQNIAAFRHPESVARGGETSRVEMR